MPRLPEQVLAPYWKTTDGSHRLYKGGAIDVLRRLPPKTVQCVVTSPPYWGLREYNPDDPDTEELGLEETPQEYVFKLLAVMEEVKRVLRDDGTLWLNLGDTHDNKSLVGIPWMVALSMREVGWNLISDIIWHKLDPMPESIKNRPTKAHEYLFLFAKNANYFYDSEPIKESSLKPDGDYEERVDYARENPEGTNGHATFHEQGATPIRRNRRSVWTISKAGGYSGGHFATFPRKLVEPCILAGTSERGACAKCGTPLRRMVESETLRRSRPNDYVKRTGEKGTGNSISNSVAGTRVTTVGWQATCGCDIEDDNDLKPCLVLDPFAGSATTLEVALDLGRNAIGIELYEKYLVENAIPRMEGALLARPALAHLTGRKAERVEIGDDC